MQSHVLARCILITNTPIDAHIDVFSINNEYCREYKFSYYNSMLIVYVIPKEMTFFQMRSTKKSPSRFELT